MKDLIRELVAAYGPSGFEDEVRAIILRHARPWADEVKTDTMGNLYVRKRGDGSGRRIMLAAHMDEIGLIVTHREENGLLRFAAVGYVTPKILLGGRVRFANGVLGVVSHDGGIRAELMDDELPEIGRWYIDVGEAECGVGEVAAFVRPYDEMGSRIVGGGLDDRVGCAVLVEVLRRLKSSPHDLTFTFTVQEEFGARGAGVAAFELEPDIGLAIDLTATGDTPRPATRLAARLGGGPAIKVADSGMIAHPRLREALVQTARQQDIPYQLEVFPHGYTDAAAIQTVRGGVIAGGVLIPCRYLHTHSEMVAEADIEHTVRLLVAFLSQPWPPDGRET